MYFQKEFKGEPFKGEMEPSIITYLKKVVRSHHFITLNKDLPLNRSSLKPKSVKEFIGEPF